MSHRFSPLRRFAVTTLQLALCATGFATVSLASPLVVSGGGIFSSNTSNTATSSSGGTFSFSFQVDSNPVSTLVPTGGPYPGFSPVFTNFVYKLNGAVVSNLLPSVSFFSNNSSSLDICFTQCSDALLDISGPQVYSGSPSSPTILTGTYTNINEYYSGGGNFSHVASQSPLTITPLVAATPEPSSIALLGTGLLGMAGVVRRRFRGKAPGGAEQAL